MNRPGRPWIRLVVITLGEALLLWGVWLGVQHEIAEVNRTVNEVSDLKDPSPFRAALMGQLGKIHVGLEGYLRSPSPSLDKQIAESRKDFEALLPEFAKENPKLFPQSANEEIQRTFGLYQESIDQAMTANAQRMDRRGILAGNFAQILNLIDHNLRPLIRKGQADASERGEAILNIENQTRAWQQNLAQAWAAPSEAASSLAYENENRGESYIELYSNMELLARERNVLHQLRSLWQANNDLARESFVKETVLGQAQKAMDAQRAQVIGVLNKFLPALPPAEMEAKKLSIMNAMRLHLTAAGLIGLLGLASLIMSAIMTYRFFQTPLPAASGVYRVPAAGQPAPSEAKFQMDLKGIITDWPEAAQAMYEFASYDMLGQSIGKLFESESEIARLGKELQKATRATFETTHKTKSGAPLRVQIDFQPVPDAAGHATAITLVCKKR